MKDYYGLLGIRHFTSNQDEIKAAYREQIRFFHPDAGNVPEEIALKCSQELNEVYAVLTNPEAKATYDEMLVRDIISRQAAQKQQADQAPPHQEPQTQQSQNSAPSGAPAKKRSTVSPYAVIAAIFAVIILVIKVITPAESTTKTGTPSTPPASSTSTANTPSTSSTPTTPTLTPVRVQNGQILVEPYDESVAPLTVATSGSGGYYIYMDSYSGFNDMAFYVVGGKSVDVLVPLDEYTIYYATGDTWYGTKNHFGPSTQYCRCDDTFEFYLDGDYYQGWTLTLYPVANGNLSTDPVSASDFPG